MSKIFYEDLIYLDMEAKDRTEAINIMTENLYEKGFVKKEFREKILEREEKYPTGIEIGKINVAIPHSEHEYVKKGAVSVAVLKNPVKFNKMDEPDQEIDVSIIMVLAISEAKGHVELLQKVFGFIENQDLLEEIMNTEEKDKIIDIFRQNLKGDEE